MNVRGMFPGKGGNYNEWEKNRRARAPGKRRTWGHSGKKMEERKFQNGWSHIQGGYKKKEKLKQSGGGGGTKKVQHRRPVKGAENLNSRVWGALSKDRPPGRVGNKRDLQNNCSNHTKKANNGTRVVREETTDRLGAHRHTFSVQHEEKARGKKISKHGKKTRLGTTG